MLPYTCCLMKALQLESHIAAALMNSIYILPARARGPSALIISASAPRAPAASLDAAARAVNVCLRLGGGIDRVCEAMSCQLLNYASCFFCSCCCSRVLCVVCCERRCCPTGFVCMPCQLGEDCTPQRGSMVSHPAAASLPNQGLAVFAGGIHGL
jgi:hypothetical protein